MVQSALPPRRWHMQASGLGTRSSKNRAMGEEGDEARFSTLPTASQAFSSLGPRHIVALCAPMNLISRSWASPRGSNSAVRAAYPCRGPPSHLRELVVRVYKARHPRRRGIILLLFLRALLRPHLSFVTRFCFVLLQHARH